MLAHGAREAPAGQHVDWQRTARFALVGLTLHGPFFFWCVASRPPGVVRRARGAPLHQGETLPPLRRRRGFKWLDGLRVATGGSPLIRAMAKSATGQVTLFPTYILAFSVYMGLLEGRRGAALAVKGCGQPDVDLPSPITSPAIIAIAVPALTRQASPPPRRKGPHVRRPGLRSREPLLAGG